jgi:hypothetical protein
MGKAEELSKMKSICGGHVLWNRATLWGETQRNCRNTKKPDEASGNSEVIYSVKYENKGKP